MRLLEHSGTTAGSAFRGSAPIIVVRGRESLGGTSIDEPGRDWERYVHPPSGTVSGPEPEPQAEVAPSVESTREAITELRRISGLTWEQLAQLFEVSRRSLHFWASGKPLNAAHEEHLMKVLEVVRHADRGSARGTRAALLDASTGGSALSRLTAKQYAAARDLLGEGSPRALLPRTPLSAAAQAARRPPPPDELVEAQGDRVHREVGRGRAARTVRSKGRGTSR